MSKATEAELWEALEKHLRDEEVLEDGELLTAWVVSIAAEVAVDAGVCRYGHSSPDGQRFHVSHGLAAQLMAGFNNTVGVIPNDRED